MARSDHRSGSQLPVTPTTLADVAERAGVSRQTVSNAVNNPDLLRPDTLERVRQTIAELGYSPNRAARNLRTRTSSLIGLRFTPAQEGTANAMMDRFVHSLVEASDEAGYHVLLFPADDEDPVGPVGSHPPCPSAWSIPVPRPSPITAAELRTRSPGRSPSPSRGSSRSSIIARAAVSVRARKVPDVSVSPISRA